MSVRDFCRPERRIATWSDARSKKPPPRQMSIGVARGDDRLYRSVTPDRTCSSSAQPCPSNQLSKMGRGQSVPLFAGGTSRGGFRVLPGTTSTSRKMNKTLVFPVKGKRPGLQFSVCRHLRTNLMEPAVGFEPTTCSLQMSCSAGLSYTGAR